MNANDTKVTVGAKVELTFRYKKTSHVAIVRIAWLEQREEGTYIGYRYVDHMKGNWGAAMVHNEPHQWGLVGFRELSKA